LCLGEQLSTESWRKKLRKTAVLLIDVDGDAAIIGDGCACFDASL